MKTEKLNPRTTAGFGLFFQALIEGVNKDYEFDLLTAPAATILQPKELNYSLDYYPQIRFYFYGGSIPDVFFFKTTFIDDLDNFGEEKAAHKLEDQLRHIFEGIVRKVGSAE